MFVPQEKDICELKVFETGDFDHQEDVAYKNQRLLNDFKLENNEKKIIITNLSTLIYSDSIK